MLGLSAAAKLPGPPTTSALGPAAPAREPDRLAIDVLLIGGQFPGTSGGEVLGDLVRYATAAECAGFDAAWIAEHHFLRYGVCPSAMALAAYLLGTTTRLHVGTAGAIVSNRHPVALAEESIMLDELSGGRFHLGLARGGLWVDLDVFGTGIRRYQTGLNESLDLLQRWLSGTSPISARGDHFRFPPVPVVPRPRRPVPVYVCATSGEMANTAGARALPLLLGMHASPANNRNLIRNHAAAAAAHGHQVAGMAHASAHLAFVGDTDAQAREVLRTTLPQWLATRTSLASVGSRTGRARDPAAYAKQLIDHHAVGSAERCLQQLTDAVAITGVRRLQLVVEAAGDADRTLDNINRLGEQVIPRLRG